MMKRRRIITALVCGLLVIGLSMGAAPAILEAGPGPIVINTGSSEAVTDGNTIVWGSGEFQGMDLASGKESDIATKAEYGGVSAIGDNVMILWQQDSPTGSYRLYGKHLDTGEEFVVAGGDTDNVYAHISGNRVVWLQNSTSGLSIMARNIETMAPAVSVYSGFQGSVGSLAFDGDRVAWEEQVYDSNHVIHWTIRTREIGGGEPKVVASGIAGYNFFGLDLQGNTLVYSVDWGLDAIDLDTGEREAISNPTDHPAQHPTTDGRFFFWEDYTRFSRSENGDQQLVNIWGYDTYTGALFPVAAGDGSASYAAVNSSYNYSPVARGGWLVWSGGAPFPSPSRNTYAMRIADLLPSARQPQAPSTSDRAYFPETGHSLAYGFKYFWDHSGGLPVFGYPLTKEYDEFNADAGKLYTVQYFERQRFEYHPENKGTPYETELGRLGAEDAAAKGLTATVPFRPRVQDTPNSATSVFFPETGHWVSNSSLAYWKSHGLDFGDKGISYRESLALFGLPLSEEYTDPSTGLTTQYFERAVFEYHPEFKGTPYEVELRLLGTESLQSRGWQ